ncbi:MAG: M20/M25/M40 family metallo-hydrolase [Bacteroidetes bacterium]|nr:M20/M25/M40 family metallo-hydrolase [Bacteroidota bacterium]
MKKIFSLLFAVSFAISASAQQPYRLSTQYLQRRNLQFPERTVLPGGTDILGETRDSHSDSLIQALIDKLDVDSMRSYIQELQDMGTRFCLAPNRKSVAEWIMNKYLSFGYTEARIDSFYMEEEWPWGSGTMHNGYQYNVEATLPGTVNPDLFYIVGGHYDAILYPVGDPFIATPGADDNATSAATALEIARIMKMEGYQPSSSIRFVNFAAEELGLYGSWDYCQKAYADQMNIGLYLNCDMTGYSSVSSGWEVNLIGYSYSEWATQLAHHICTNFTTLIPDSETVDSQGSDSFLFYAYGFPTTYLEEKEFSPVYHSIDDIVDTLNMPYCREVAKLAFGILLSVDMMPQRVRNLQLSDPGTGTELSASWLQNQENNIAGYYVYFGLSSGVYDTMYFTTDTSFILSGLTTGTTYYTAVSAVNTIGNESILSEVNDKPAVVTLDQGILIVDDSNGGLLNPTDAAVDDFYGDMCSAFQFTHYDATAENQITLADLGKYQAVLWHINRKMTSSVLLRYKNEVKKYLGLGGKIFFSLYQPSLCFDGDINYPQHFYPFQFSPQFPKIDSSYNSSQAYFFYANPTAAGYPAISADSLKTSSTASYHLNNIEAIFPGQQGTAVYTYGSLYDSTSANGSYQGYPVGIEYIGADYSVVTISFPLFFMETDAAKELTEFVFSSRFGLPLSVHESPEEVNDLHIFPNPATGSVTIVLPENTGGRLRIFNSAGSCVYEFNPKGETMKSVNTSQFASGLYLLKFDSGNKQHAAKLMVK